MKRIFLTVLAAVLCSVALAQSEENTKTGILLANEHKIVVEARRSSMNFNEIEASRAIRVIVEERTTGNIIVRAPQSVMPYVSLSVKGNTLHATLLSGVPAQRNSNVLAEIYVPYNGRLNEITTRSAAKVIVKPTLSCDELDLEASSASYIELKAGVKQLSIEAAADELEVELLSASFAKLSGQVTDADVEVSGASTLRAESLRAANIELECSGASKASALGVACTTKATGASSIVVESLAVLNASASGASSIRYSGDCQVNILDNSGASTIRKK